MLFFVLYCFFFLKVFHTYMYSCTNTSQLFINSHRYAFCTFSLAYERGLLGNAKLKKKGNITRYIFHSHEIRSILLFRFSLVKKTVFKNVFTAMIKVFRINLLHLLNILLLTGVARERTCPGFLITQSVEKHNILNTSKRTLVGGLQKQMIMIISSYYKTDYPVMQSNPII